MKRKILELIKENIVFIKFGISGLSALAVDLIFLYTLKGLFGMSLIFSLYSACAISFVFGFSLQKFWAFKNNEKEAIHKQFVFYVILGIVVLNVNAVSVAYIVENFHVHYLLTQALVSIILGLCNFLIYRFFIFKETKCRAKKLSKVLKVAGDTNPS